MPDHSKIYREEAESYHELIAAQPPLAGIVEKIKPFAGLDIVDLGAGTGRLSAVLAPEAKSVTAVDASPAMLEVAARRLREAGLNNWQTVVADHRRLPLEENSADLAVIGWSLCYLASSNVQDWENNLREAIAEVKRIVRRGGSVVIFETLGTGYETPHAPDFLRNYYAALVESYGFSHRWIRTDYAFESVEQAERLTRFFFGDECGDRVVRERLVRLPECAGVWWLHL